MTFAITAGVRARYADRFGEPGPDGSPRLTASAKGYGAFAEALRAKAKGLRYPVTGPTLPCALRNI